MKDLFTMHEELTAKGYHIATVIGSDIYYSNDKETIFFPIAGVESEYDIEKFYFHMLGSSDIKLAKPDKFYKLTFNGEYIGTSYPLVNYEGEEFVLTITSDFTLDRKSEEDYKVIEDMDFIKKELINILDGNIPFIMNEDGDICINTFFGSIKYNDYTLEIWCDEYKAEGYEVYSVLPEIASTLYSAYLPIVLQDEEIKSRLNELIIP